MSLGKKSKKIIKTRKLSEPSKPDVPIKLIKRKRGQPVIYYKNPFANSQEVNELGIPLKYGAYNLEKYQQFLELRNSLAGKTQLELHALLRMNKQHVRGNYQDVLDRVADCMLQGRIEMCRTCFNAHLLYDQSDGLYQCQGFRNRHQQFIKTRMINDFKAWYIQYPLFTRTFITIAAVFGMLQRFRTATQYNIAFDIDKICRFQIHRLFTHYFWQGTMSFNFLFRIMMLYFSLSNSEKIFEGNNYADFYFFVLYIMSLGNIFAWLFEFPSLGTAFVFALIYLWCKRRPFETVRFYFGFQIKSEYFPWVLIAFDFITEQDIFQDFIGLAIAHSYLLLVDFLPVTYGRAFLKTPAFLQIKSSIPSSRFVNKYITPYAPFAAHYRPNQAQQAQQNRFFAGQAHRLG